MANRCHLYDNALDDDGNAIVGAKIYFFAAGTGTEQTEPSPPTGTAVTGSFFAANSGGVALSNGVTTDSQGYYSVYFASAQSVDIIVSSNNGTATVNGVATPFDQKLRDFVYVQLAPEDAGTSATVPVLTVDYLLTYDGTDTAAINGRTGATDYGGAADAGSVNGADFSTVFNAVSAALGARGPTNHSLVINSASMPGGGSFDATYTCATAIPQPGQYVTVTGMTPSGYNFAALPVKSVNVGLATFTVTLTVSGLAAGGAGQVFSQTPGGSVQILNISSNNQAIPVHSTLRIRDGMTVFGTGQAKRGQTTPAGTGAFVHADTGSVLLQATSSFTGDSSLTAADQKCVINARGGGATADDGDLENVSILNLGVDGNDLADIGILARGSGTGNAMVIFNCRVYGNNVANVQMGGSNDTTNSTDLYMSHCDISQLGTGATSAGSLTTYTGDATITYCNFVTSGDNHSILMNGGSVTRIFESHIGGGGANFSDVKIKAGQNIEFGNCYFDNIGSSTKFRAGIVIEQGGGSAAALTIRDNYFNLNGMVPCILFDHTNGGTTYGRMLITGNRTSGSQTTVGGVDFNAPAFVAVVGGNIRSKNVTITDNNAASVSALVAGDTNADTAAIFSRGNWFVPSSTNGAGGGQFGVTTATINSTTATIHVNETIATPPYPAYGTEPGTDVFIPFNILIESELMCVTNRVLDSGTTYSYTVTRHVMGTTASTHNTIGTAVSAPKALLGNQEQWGQATLVSGQSIVNHSMWANPKTVELTPFGFTRGSLETFGVGTVGMPSALKSESDNISTFTATGTGPYTVTFTTATAHKLTAGSTVTIASVLSSGTQLNGVYPVDSSADNTHFVITVIANPGTYTSGGTAAGPTVQGVFTINSSDGASTKVVGWAGHCDFY